MEKVERIRKWLQEKGYDALILSRRDNYAWMTDGAKNHVMWSVENGVGHLVVTVDRIWLVADSSDAARLTVEQNPLQAEMAEVPWYGSVEDKICQILGGKTAVSDTGMAGTDNVQSELLDLRMDLSPQEIRQYREIGKECAGIVEGVCKDARRGQTEAEIAAKLRCRCIRAGISPDCVLVGADERILQYRHPMPTDKEIRQSLMVVLGGEKYGLNISMTRMVYFEPIPEMIQERYEKTQQVFANMQLQMKEGMAYGDYFSAVRTMYTEAGYPDEWQKHHQGGPTGYGCREIVVGPKTQGCIRAGRAYAWNPTIQGTKCEETTLLLDHGVEILTRTPEWPCKWIDTPDGSLSVAEILKQY